MGEVYRARDTRLGRDVAIKILSQHLSANPDLKQRFEREARAVSALNHPRICTLHDIGYQEGIDFPRDGIYGGRNAGPAPEACACP
jgi:serine/threonine protein kinase